MVLCFTLGGMQGREQRQAGARKINQGRNAIFLETVCNTARQVFESSEFYFVYFNFVKNILTQN